ncbi:MAG: hypothetical protein ACM31C_25595, partial [Acidobacteriota bacterium]
MKRISLVLLAAALAAPACSSSSSGGGGGTGSDVTCGNAVCDPGEDATSCPVDCGGTNGDQWDQILGQRVVDYNAALRIAALRLTGKLPTMAEIDQIATAPDDASKKAAYTSLITQYMNTDDFKRQMFYFWRDTFKQGGDGTTFDATLDTAPAFAAQLSVTNGSYMDLFTASSGNCPTYDLGANFTPADCANGGPKAGVLTNPGVMKQFFSNFAFRRVRWIQETFVCTKFPAEVSSTPTDVGGAAPYTGVWPFNSISSPTNGGGRVNFQDVSAVICANCHSTINHIAPLFAYYDINGQHTTSISVPTPLDGAPLAQMTDYLPSTETTAWRFGQPAADVTALGAAMAADPAVAECGVARMWNWALGKTDIVDTLQEVPKETIQAQVDAFTQSGFKLKDLIFAV